jgi:hypothetical protein
MLVRKQGIFFKKGKKLPFCPSILPFVIKPKLFFDEVKTLIIYAQPIFQPKSGAFKPSVTIINMVLCLA